MDLLSKALPEDVSINLGKKIKAPLLQVGWKRSTLAERAGVRASVREKIRASLG